MTILDDARPGMNDDIRPQDDLFGHVNGRWLAETDIPGDRSSWGPFVELADTAEMRVREIIEGGDAEGFAGGIRAIRARPDSSSSLEGIGVPALVIVGEEDVLTPPSDSEAMAAVLPRCRLVKLPRAGHLSSLESPRDFSTALCDFLTSPL